jgi:hypothetical protein
VQTVAMNVVRPAQDTRKLMDPTSTCSWTHFRRPKNVKLPIDVDVLRSVEEKLVRLDDWPDGVGDASVT